MAHRLIQNILYERGSRLKWEVRTRTKKKNSKTNQKERSRYWVSGLYRDLIRKRRIGASGKGRENSKGRKRSSQRLEKKKGGLLPKEGGKFTTASAPDQHNIIQHRVVGKSREEEIRKGLGFPRYPSIYRESGGGSTKGGEAKGGRSTSG